MHTHGDRGKTVVASVTTGTVDVDVVDVVVDVEVDSGVVVDVEGPVVVVVVVVDVVVVHIVRGLTGKYRMAVSLHSASSISRRNTALCTTHAYLYFAVS